MIGPQDYIDELLVKKYAERQVNNMEDVTKYAISPEKYWEIMRDYSQVKMTMYNISSKFSKKNPDDKKVKPTSSPA